MIIQIRKYLILEDIIDNINNYKVLIVIIIIIIIKEHMI